MPIQVSIYLSEADKCKRTPLHRAVVEYLYRENIAGATVIRAVGGFTGRGPLKTGVGGHGHRKLPLIVTFIDTEPHVRKVLPHLRELVGNRLIVKEKVALQHGVLD